VRTGLDPATEVWFSSSLDGDLLTGADLVLLRLAKAVEALDEVARAVARAADPDVVLLAGGRNRHLSRRMNTALSQSFEQVRASLGRQKSRLLIATSPHPGVAARFPVVSPHPELDLVVAAHGGVFAGSRVDLGSRVLLEALQVPAAARMVADLGCGSGVLTTALARRAPGAQVLAVDDSAAACRSTEQTVARNGVAARVRVQRADLLAPAADGSLDLVLCNPPFHRGTARESADAFAMISDSARALRDGGELWLVYNAHLPYLPALNREVGPTEIVRRTKAYLVTRSVRRPRQSAVHRSRRPGAAHHFGRPGAAHHLGRPGAATA
jgi:16S rRNA (guanine1207-N2)-methyltransferase